MKSNESTKDSKHSKDYQDQLIACHECDLLHSISPIPSGGKALCTRCGAFLYRNTPNSHDRALALNLAALMFFIMANAFLTGLMTLVYALSQNVWVAVALAFAFGPPNAMRDVAQDTLLQGTVENGQLGRVYATRQMLASLVFMVAGLCLAWLSDHVPIRIIYVAGGIIYILTGFYALSNRALRDSRMDFVENGQAVDLPVD